jgi:hypothetical protein
MRMSGSRAQLVARMVPLERFSPMVGGSFSRGHIADELPVANDVGRLSGNALVIEREGSHAGAVFDARVANGVDQIGAVAQMIQLVEC